MSSSIAVSGIAAQAFRLMEMSPISSFGDDSEQGISAADQYPVALDMCLEENDWSFASRIVQLPEVIETAIDPDLVHAFARPADLVRLLDVYPADVLFRLDASHIRADAAGPLTIRYTQRVSDETRLPGLFKTAVAYRLASLLAPRWTTSMNRAAELYKISEDYIGKAKKSDRLSASGRRFDGRARGDDWVDAATAPLGGWWGAP